MIGNGTNNVAQGMYSFVGNGGGATAPVPLNNRALADFSFIGSGEELLVDTNAHFSAIVSGQTNTVSGGYMHSFIGGGVGNTVNGSCSAVLGGQNNVVNNDLTAVFGSGIATTTVPGPSSMWVDELVLPNIPVGSLSGGIPIPPFGYPTGSLWYYPDANGNNVVYVV